MKTLRLIELFAGYGSQAMALRNIGVPFENYRVCEFDKYAIASYNAVHGTNFPVSDIREWKGSDLGIEDKEHYRYLMTYSFPCTDISVAGKQMGMKRGSGTRSSLLWEVERLLNETEELPDILLMENVPQVHSKKNMNDFENWLKFLEGKGYRNFYKDLNAKDYGVAQNRNRCFMVSLLEGDYVFPDPVPLTKIIKDYLEPEVADKYYINNERTQKLIDDLIAKGVIPENGEEYGK